MNFRQFAFDQLIKARAKIEAEIEARLADERLQLIEAVRELSGRKANRGSRATARYRHPSKGRKLPPKYRNPDNRGETWAGRGTRPRWLTAALKKGKKLEAFAV